MRRCSEVSFVGTPLGLCVGTNEGLARGVDDGEVVGAQLESIELSAQCPLHRTFDTKMHIVLIVLEHVQRIDAEI